MCAVSRLHLSEAGTYMCSPVFVPQMVGMALLPGADTPKVSTAQVPFSTKAPALPTLPLTLPVVAEVEN